jgi:D-aminoacyl-tRNA deacylase
VIGIVVSRADEASVSIGSQLRTLADWTAVEDGVYRRGNLELREFEALHLELDEVARAFDDPEYVVVASKHSGETGPLLSAHFTGNFGAAEYGGSPRELVETAPGALKHVIQSLAEDPPGEYEVSMECTHHGPTDLGAPGMFVELGSGPEQWGDEVGARAVAEAILSLDGVAPEADRTVVAFGGNHYAPQPTRLLLETDVAVGHVAADWSIEELGDPEAERDLLAKMFERSGTDMAVVDGEWPEIEAAVESLGYRIVSETWLRETSSVDPALIESVETALGPIGDGVRIGAKRAGEHERVELPGELVDACAAVDPERTVAAVHEHAVAYVTAENGNRVGDAALLPEDGDDDLIDALVQVLETEYASVDRADGAVVAERDVFDPELAQDQGVPEGPLFGQLAAGESVTVDGETVTPDAVHVRETTRFDV